MLYVSVRWSRLQGLNFSKSAGVIGRTEDMVVVGAKVVWELVKLESWTCFLIAPWFGTNTPKVTLSFHSGSLSAKPDSAYNRLISFCKES